MDDFMRVKDLKSVIQNLHDDMLIVIPVIETDDEDSILAFKKVRTAGILVSEHDRRDPEVLCLNSSTEGQDIADQIAHSGKDIGVKAVLYGRYRDTEEVEEK